MHEQRTPQPAHLALSISKARTQISSICDIQKGNGGLPARFGLTRLKNKN